VGEDELFSVPSKKSFFDEYSGDKPPPDWPPDEGVGTGGEIVVEFS
jgi:hypothetical protein